MLLTYKTEIANSVLDSLLYSVVLQVATFCGGA